MRTQKLAASFLPDLPGKRRPSASSARSLSPPPVHGEGAHSSGRRVTDTPRGPHQMVADLSAWGRPSGEAGAGAGGSRPDREKLPAPSGNHGARSSVIVGGGKASASSGARAAPRQEASSNSGLRSTHLTALRGAKPGFAGALEGLPSLDLRLGRLPNNIQESNGS